jgi:sugar O-acyltransferase (sialic acid O-acetyltransferase NeuD family)
MKDKLIIIGASGHGKVVADIAINIGKWKSIAFLDDDESIKTCMGLDVIGKTNDAFTFTAEADFFVAIGNNAAREKMQHNLMEVGLNVVSLIHPCAVMGTDVHVGSGSVVMAGVVINSSSRIGEGCILNTGATIDHDNIIEDYVHISPGVNLAGTVIIGKGSWIGVGSVVSNNLNICSGSKIGAGAVVVKDITEPGTYVGVPAKRVG